MRCGKSFRILIASMRSDQDLEPTMPGRASISARLGQAAPGGGVLSG